MIHLLIMIHTAGVIAFVTLIVTGVSNAWLLIWATYEHSFTRSNRRRQSYKRLYLAIPVVAMTVIGSSIFLSSKTFTEWANKHDRKLVKPEVRIKGK